MILNYNKIFLSNLNKSKMLSYPGRYDIDALSYFEKASIVSRIEKKRINNFILGIKRLNYWNRMVCWALRPGQNIGTGTIVYSLGGLGDYNGQILGGAVRSGIGINFNSLGAHIYVESIFHQPFTALVAANFKTNKNAGTLISGPVLSNRVTMFSAPDPYKIAIFAEVPALYSNPYNFILGNNLIGGYFNGANSALYLNQSIVLGATGPAPLGGAVFNQPNNFIIGNNYNKNDGEANLDIAFCVIFNGAIDHGSVYNLYTRTLGQNLDIP